ncbi:MAG: UvrD-helicase domain-containing protein [Bacteroidales bacterium]|jgi:ATP-dependent exoDNAse (exonuclease V) beta subunit|nr:UvrD-helicase domain-containing protein [Bacteroidales bacterium]
MFKIYQASAGSGKTTHLVAEYLLRCFEALSQNDMRGYRHILAITFTNNATAEMKERIITTLSHFAFTEDYSTLSISHQAILKMIGGNLDLKVWNVEQIRSSSLLLLKDILYNYNDFSISTIDSFFQRIIRGFAIELGLNMNFNLEIDQSEFYSQAIDLLLSKISKQEFAQPYSLSKQVMTIVDQNLDQQGKNRLEKELRDFLDIMHKEDSYYSLKNLQNIDRQEFREYCQNVVKQRDEAKRKFVQIVEEGDTIFKNSGFDPENFFYGKNGPYFWFQKLKENPDKLPAQGRMEEALNNNEFLSGTFQKKSGASFHDHRISELYNQTVEQYQRCADLRVLCENINTFSLIFDLQEILNDIKQHDNIFFLCDTNFLINNEIRENDTPFIFEKLGNRYQDFLIDEFQDTSRMQWEDLLPLVKNAIAGGYSRLGNAILFGDAKQAIYRFRSGEADLFQQLSTEEGYKKAMGWAANATVDFRREALTTNYRSSQAIVDFNNKFFTYLKEITDKEDLVFSKAAEYYSDVVQQNPKGATKPGFVSVRFKNEEDGKDYVEQEILQVVGDALARGFNCQDIAILSRGVEQSVNLARCLAGEGFPVISSDSLLLNTSEEVRVIIAALQDLLNPDDEIAQTVIFSYLSKKISTGRTLEELLLLRKIQSFSSILKEFSIDFNYKRLLELPLYTLIKELMILFDFQSVNAYITTFLDKVCEFMQKKNCSISSFLNYWDEKKEKLSLSSPKNFNAITVTTVHKSKGLQYPVVIFPFSSFGSRLTKSMVWQKRDNGEKITHSPLKMSKTLEETQWKDIYKEEEAMTRLDDLNILYVAHTRAVHCFYIITAKPDKGNYSKFLSQFIHNHTEEKSDHYLFGDQDFSVKKRELPKTDDTTQLLPFSDFVPSEEKLLYGKIANRNQRQITGIAVHDYLSKMEKFPQSQTEIENLYIALDAENALRIKQTLSNILEDRQLAPFFSDRATTWREVSILTTDGQLFRPDRMALLDGKVLVVDYKTGQEREADQRQLQQYVALIHEMGYPQVEGKLIYI